MKDKMFRSIALAVVAAFTVGLAAHAEDMTATTSVSNDNSTLVAMNCGQKKKTYRRCARRVAKKSCAKRVAAKPAITTKETTVTKTETIEKPVVIQAPAQEQQTQQVIQQPAVIPETPVVIDRYQKIHRSLIHLGLFPFNLFGQ